MLAHARRHLRTAAVLLAAWMCYGTAWAWPNDTTQEELALLPPYCAHVQTSSTGTPEGYAKWKGVYGETYHHLHHYCYAMVYLMRADRHTNTSIDRSFDLSSAFREIEYVIERAPRDYMLRPEMLTKQGMIMRRLDRLDKAMSLLEQARSLDPTYWRAYYEIANCQLARNRKDEARETLKQGLAASPNARVLRAMLDDLGGGGPTKATAPQSVSGAALRASGGEESDSPNAGAR